MKPRARDLGIQIGRLSPGPENAITDVAGVRVGHTTLVEGDDVRTGVTVVVPPPEPLFAGCHRINGNGELTGLEWVRDSGLLWTPVALTNTHSVGVVHDALIAAMPPGTGWSLPVVGETFDGFLNDINGFHVRAEHVGGALESASGGAVAEGSVGGGTGMVCHGFKGGIGTSSRVLDDGATVGVLVQANHGARRRLRVNGSPIGERIGRERIPEPRPGDEGSSDEGAGSIIVLIATDAPLLPGQCERLARRAGFGIARTGGMGEISSGDFALCFATGNRGLAADVFEVELRMRSDRRINELYEAVIDAVEESIVNALLAAETMTGRGGNTVYALEPELLSEALKG